MLKYSILLCLLIFQGVLFYALTSLPSVSEKGTAVAYSTTSKQSSDFSSAILTIESPEEDSSNPFVQSKVESRIVENNTTRVGESNFSSFEKSKDTQVSITIGCYSQRFPISESKVADGHICKQKQFRI